jgi:eukaryotic-like serine/threonine-protein kinase
MDQDRWQQIESLFHKALERPPEDRAAFLAQACSGDSELRRQVEGLLAQDHASSSNARNSPNGFLDRPAWEGGDGLPDPSVTRLAATALTAGTQIGFYVIEAEVGRGGMGVVYKGRDNRLNRPVAIKFLSSELTDVTARRRFQREAQMASALNHPHIVTVYDVGESEGHQFLVTEFVEGGTLKGWAGRQARSWQEVVELLTGVADALATAHQAGILHRDIKPDNILITASGYAKLADFGLAKLEEKSRPSDATRTLTEGHTFAGAIIGTIAYMSPEQASGLPLDVRSDIFSFGVLLYESLAGRRPFSAATGLELLQKVIHESPAPLGGEIPEPLRALVAKALEKDPADRYSSMQDLVVDLRRALRHSTQPAPRRRKEWIAAAGIAGLILAAAGGVIWLRPASGRGPQEYIPLTNFSDSVVAPALSPDGRMLAFLRGSSTFNGPADVYVKLLPDGEPVQLTHDGREKTGPLNFSADGSRIAYSVGVKDSWTVPVLGGEPVRMLANAGTLSWTDPGARPAHVMYSSKIPGEGDHMGIFTATESRSEERKVYLPAEMSGMAHRSFLSPDRKSVMIVEMGFGRWLPCRIVPFDGSSGGHLAGPAAAECTDAAWSPDGKWMYFAANTGEGFHIWRQHFPDGKPEQVTFGATEEQGLSFAPDGKSFVTSVGESQSTLWVHDAKGDRQITFEGYAFLPSFSSDTKRLYYLERTRASRRFVSGELWVEDLEAGKKQHLFPDILMEHYDVSRDGKQVIFIADDGTGHTPLWIAALDGSSAPRRLLDQDCVRAFFAPDGDIYLVGGPAGNTFVQRIKSDGTGLQRVVPEEASFLYSISPDGKWLPTWVGTDVKAYPSDGGSPELICANCGSSGAEDRGLTPPLANWSRDGKLFYLHFQRTRQTFAVPLRPGQILPPRLASEIEMGNVEHTIPGARAIPEQRAFMSADDPSVYAYPRVATHRNIYRIPVPSP